MSDPPSFSHAGLQGRTGQMASRVFGQSGWQTEGHDEVSNGVARDTEKTCQGHITRRVRFRG
jgi:hypothetical protein